MNPVSHAICWQAAMLASDAQSMAIRVRTRLLATSPSFVFRAVADIYMAWALYKLSAILKKLDQTLASHRCLSCAQVVGCEGTLRVIEIGGRGLDLIDDLLTQTNNELMRGALAGAKIREITTLAGHIADLLDDLRLIQSGRLAEKPIDEGFEPLEEYLAKRQ